MANVLTRLFQLPMYINNSKSPQTFLIIYATQNRPPIKQKGFQSDLINEPSLVNQTFFGREKGL